MLRKEYICQNVKLLIYKIILSDSYNFYLLFFFGWDKTIIAKSAKTQQIRYAIV